VLAVLSQRLGVDLVLAGSEARALADQSVGHHMRLLTGVAPNGSTLYTYSPSEPILALAAASILHDRVRDDRVRDRGWGPVLDTFSKNLCKSGLVEKGLLGELAARTLLIIARDFATPDPNLLNPILLLDFLDTLFGNKSWRNSGSTPLADTFADTYVDFTHWIVTKDSISEAKDQ
jgi:hypothetical protein